MRSGCCMLIGSSFSMVSSGNSRAWPIFPNVQPFGVSDCRHDTHDTRVQEEVYLGGPGVQQLGSSSYGGRERRRADGALPRTLRRLGCAYRRRLRAARRCGELGVATGLGSECLL